MSTPDVDTAQVDQQPEMLPATDETGESLAPEASHGDEPMAPPDGVFDGPYDAKVALEQIFALEDDVEEAARVYDRAAAKAKELRDALNSRREELDALIRGYRDQSRNGVVMQPRLRTIREAADENEDIEQRRARIAVEVKERGLYVDAADLADLTREDLDTLDRWVRTPGPVPPELLSRAHVAGEIGPIGEQQLCTRCGHMLALADDAYEVGAFVGMNCPGVSIEKARPTAKRGAKKRKKADPEAERAQQRADAAARGDDTAHIAGDVSESGIQACQKCGLILASTHTSKTMFEVDERTGSDCPGIDLSADAPKKTRAKRA